MSLNKTVVFVMTITFSGQQEAMILMLLLVVSGLSLAEAASKSR